MWDCAEEGKHGELAGSFTPGGLAALAEALVMCNSLTSFALEHNKIEVSPEAMRLLEAANRRRAKPVTLGYR